VAAALTVLAAAAAVSLRAETTGERPARREVALAMALAFAWTALSGAGGVGYQRGDWLKHNAVLKDLIEKPWPPAYTVRAKGPWMSDEQPRPLVFYLAYYLPAALVGKLAGWWAGNAALFVWTWLGAALALLWARRLGGRAGPWLLVLAGGLDLLGILVRQRRLMPVDLPTDTWAGSWLMQSASGLLFWVPHQALGGWLAAALTLDGHRRRLSPRAATLEAFGAAFWSPFATLGLVPFWALRVARSWRAWLLAWPNWTFFPLLAGVLGSFYVSIQQPLPSAFLGTRIFGPLGPRYLLYSLVEWGLLLALCRPWRLPEWRGLWLAAALTLALVPFVRSGLFNDFAMRVPIPALFVLWMLVARRLTAADSRGWRSALRAAVAVAALTGFQELVISARRFRLGPPPAAAVAEVPFAHRDLRIGAQYLGAADSWFFRRLARPLPEPP
jgi:hypothetical protein